MVVICHTYLKQPIRAEATGAHCLERLNWGIGMAKFIVEYSFGCPNGHLSPGEFSVEAESLAEAESKTRELDLPTDCPRCPAGSPKGEVRIVRVEPAPACSSPESRSSVVRSAR